MPKQPGKFKRAQSPNVRRLDDGKRKKKEVHPIRRTEEYKAFRLAMLDDNPICCKDGCHKESTDIHHIERITDRPDLAYDSSNVICVCSGCHYQIESAVNRGIDMNIWGHMFEGLL